MSYYKEKWESLSVNFKKHSLWITLDRPEASNAFTEGMVDALVTVLQHADDDDKVRVVVITGEGNSFCAGGDLKAMKDRTGIFAGDSAELMRRYQRGIQRIPTTIEKMRKPLIAMVNGAAIGAGCDLACMCDLRVGSEKSRFGETFTRLGLIPGDGGAYFLTRIVGHTKAMEMTLTAGIYKADEAHAMGLLNFKYDHDELADRTQDLVDKIAANAPISVQMAKQAIKFSARAELSQILELASVAQALSQRTLDHEEGVDALLLSREPDFKNR